jgi:outer membrane protein, multidrug efflux system
MSRYNRMPTVLLRRCGVWAFSLCGVLTAGCALIHGSTAPRTQIPPEQIRIADDIHLARDGWPAARWWTQYDDPQLNALIDRALASSPTILLARTRVEQAQSDVELARAGTGLQIAAAGSLIRERVSSNSFLGPYGTTNPVFGTTGPWYTEGILGVAGSYDLDIWGKRRAQVEAAIGAHNARLAETAAVELELSSDVAQLYYGIQTNLQLLVLLGQLREVADFTVETHAARVARGLESRTALEQARAQQLAVKQRIDAAQAQITRYRESLRALIGAGPGDLPDIAPVPLPQPQAGLPPTLSYELLARRPDLQAMRWYLESSFDLIDAAKAAFYPSFDIKAFFGVDSVHLSQLFQRASQQIALIPGLSLPIFDGGRLNANLHGTRAASNALIEQYNQAVLNAVRDVAQTASGLQDLDDEASLQAQKVDAVAFASDSAEAHYQTGLADRLTAMEARVPLITEQIGLLTLDAQRTGADIMLIKALGGGYRNASPAQVKPR